MRLKKSLIWEFNKSLALFSYFFLLFIITTRKFKIIQGLALYFCWIDTTLDTTTHTQEIQRTEDHVKSHQSNRQH